MHSIVAKERAAIEAHTVKVKGEIKRDTPVVVATVGSLLRRSAQGEVCKEAGLLLHLA